MNALKIMIIIAGILHLCITSAGLTMTRVLDWRHKLSALDPLTRHIIWTHGAFVLLAIWVAPRLHHVGRVFLIKAFHGNETVADSVNHLLVVGFYLINIGYVTLALKYGDKQRTTQEAIEFLSTKVGLVLVVLGAM